MRRVLIGLASDLIVSLYNVSEDLRSDYERAVHKQVSRIDNIIATN